MSSKSRIRLFKTISVRIALWYSLSVILILLSTDIFMYYRLRHTLNKETDRILFDVSEDVLDSIKGFHFSVSDLQKMINIESSSQKYLRASIRLYDIEQNTFISSENFFAPNLKISDDDIANAIKGENTLSSIWVEGLRIPYRLITRYVEVDNSCKYILQIGIYMRLSYKTVENMQENFLMLVPVFIILGIIGGWLVSRKSLSPIKKIIENTREINSSTLNARLVSAETGDELDELAKTINLMLDRIEASFNRITQFTSDVSHELRTPIASLKTGTEVILSKERTVEEYRGLHEDNLIALERMARMISDLLALSRSDSGADILHLKAFNLSNMLKELQNKFRPVSDSKKIGLSVSGIQDVQVNGDETLLRRVFSNLLDNAIKYTLPGGCINVSLGYGKDEVIVRIEDTGIGMYEDHLEKIFDRFFRVDPSRSRETGGTGLGLNICKNIADLHKGKIEVISKLGVGSTFVIKLPKDIKLG